jgi:hypothetical protein
MQVETIAIAKLRSDPKLPFRREIILTKDGGAVAIDWEHFDMEEHVSGCSNLVLIGSVVAAPVEAGEGCYNCLRKPRRGCEVVLSELVARLRTAAVSSRGAVGLFSGLRSRPPQARLRESGSWPAGCLADPQTQLRGAHAICTHAHALPPRVVLVEPRVRMCCPRAPHAPRPRPFYDGTMCHHPPTAPRSCLRTPP